MRQIPIRIKTAYEALLAEKKIPKTSHFYYLKWFILVQNSIFTAEAQRTQRKVFVCREFPTNKNILS